MKNNFFEFDDDLNDVECEEDEHLKIIKKSKEEKIKSRSLFDHLKAITELPYNKNYFDDMSENDKKTFSIYMINRYLSMNSDWLSIVNYFQQFTSYVSINETYKFYSSIISKNKIFLKYIKGKKEIKYNKNLIDILCQYYLISTKESVEYLDIFYSIPDGVEMVKHLCSLYGNDEKEIKILTKAQ